MRVRVGRGVRLEAYFIVHKDNVTVLCESQIGFNAIGVLEATNERGHCVLGCVSQIATMTDDKWTNEGSEMSDCKSVENKLPCVELTLGRRCKPYGDDQESGQQMLRAHEPWKMNCE